MRTEKKAIGVIGLRLVSVLALAVQVGAETANMGEARQVAGNLVRAVLVNSGNANACTGSAGIDHVRTVCHDLAGALNIPDSQVLMSSTGIIGVPLPIQLISGSISRLVGALSPDGIDDFAHAIAEYNEALRIDPSLLEPHLFCGVAHNAIGNLEEAIVSYRRALSIDPRSADVHNRLAWLFATAHTPRSNAARTRWRMPKRLMNWPLGDRTSWTHLPLHTQLEGTFRVR